jgi:type II secretory pathway pseudopilin PulG
MVKLAQQSNVTSLKVAAMTLVEVLVALAIVSFVFSSLTQMTFDALKRAKKLELQDKMRNYATEASQVIYNKKNANWKEFSEIQLPPANSSIDYTQTHLLYTTDANTGQVKIDLKKITFSQCSFDGKTLTGIGCVDTAPPETANNLTFGRLIVRSDDAIQRGPPTPNTANDATIDIIVACLKDKCDPEEFPPFILNLAVYRTGGTQ